MCIKNFIGEKVIFDRFTAFFNLDIFQPSLIYNTAGSAYFMKSSPPLFHLNSLHTCSRYISDVHEEFLC